MSKFEEQFYSGFCKALNQTRTVLCEIERDDDGTVTSLEADCAFGDCPHTGDCLLMSQAPAAGKS